MKRLEITLVLTSYILVAYFVVKYIRSAEVQSKTSCGAKLMKSLILAVLFGPSALISVHLVIPLPALLGLVAGISYESVRVSSIEAIFLFACSVAFSSAILYWYFTVTTSIRLDQCLNVNTLEKPTSQTK